MGFDLRCASHRTCLFFILSLEKQAGVELDFSIEHPVDGSIIGYGFDFVFDCGFVMDSLVIILPPNKSPEPIAVGAGSSAIAVHVPSRRWLSFFR